MTVSDKYKKIAETELGGSLIKAWLSTDPIDLQWDSFVESAPGGRHEQLSLWAQVKSLSGWNPIRVVLTDHGQIIGGLQLLWIPKPPFGRIGYVSHGPVIAEDDPAALAFALDQLQAIVRKHRIRAVIVQTPCHSENISDNLHQKGFLPNILYKKLIDTTLQIDLGKSEDELLRQMRTTTRQNIRKAIASDISFREGGESELGIFFALMLETCRRQGISPNPPSEDVLKTMWQLFHPKGYLRLFFLQHRDELVLGELAVTLGDRFLLWKTGWSGKYSNMKPNDARHWYLIKWAKTKGYRYYDFGSVNRKTALLIKQKGTLPKEIIKTPSFFKLGFGGEIVYLPEANVYIPNVILKSLYRIACLIQRFRH